MVSTCVKFPDTPKQIRELVTFNGGGMCQQYHQQGLDCTGRGNGNCGARSRARLFRGNK